MTNETPRVTYDHHTDTIYVTYERAPAGTTTEDGDVLRRYDHDGKLIGITVMEFSEWLRRALGELTAQKES